MVKNLSAKYFACYMIQMKKVDLQWFVLWYFLIFCKNLQCYILDCFEYRKKMRYRDVAWEFVGDRFSSGIPIVFFLQGVTIKDISLMCTEEGIIGLCLGS